MPPESTRATPPLAAALPALLVVVALSVPARAAHAQTSVAPPLSAGRQARTLTITLREVLDSVVTRYPAVEAARARIRAARGTRTTAGLFGNPILAYEVDNAPFPGQGAQPLPPGMERENMTTATLPLASLYQRGARVRQADAAVRAAEADARAERQRVALDAARAYYRTALATVSAGAAENLARWLDSVVAYNRTRVRQGAAAEADLIRSQLERDRAVADAGIEAAELARARADLSAFLGDPGAAPTDLMVTLDDVPLLISSPTPVATASSMARPGPGGGPSLMPSATLAPRTPVVDRRPDVIAARERLAAAGAGAAVEQQMIIHELGATFGVKQSAGTNTLIAGVSVPLPLFDQNRGELARARAERDVAAYELESQERTARAEVVGAEAAARILTERAVVLTVRGSTGRGSAYLARADEARAITFGAYREGAVTLLQVLDAARAWGEARVAYYRALYAQHEAVLSLLVARGDDLATALPILTPSAPAPPGPSSR